MEGISRVAKALPRVIARANTRGVMRLRRMLVQLSTTVPRARDERGRWLKVDAVIPSGSRVDRFLD